MDVQDPAESDNEWEEETLLMLQLPSRTSGNKDVSDSYCQILGISTGEPLVRVKTQLFSGKVSQTLGTHLFFEIEGKPGSAHAKKQKIKATTLSDKTMDLEPAYLQPKDKTSEGDNKASK